MFFLPAVTAPCSTVCFYVVIVCMGLHCKTMHFLQLNSLAFSWFVHGKLKVCDIYIPVNVTFTFLLIWTFHGTICCNVMWISRHQQKEYVKIVESGYVTWTSLMRVGTTSYKICEERHSQSKGIDYDKQWRRLVAVLWMSSGKLVHLDNIHYM